MERVTQVLLFFHQELPEYMAKARLGINLRETGSLNDYYSLPNKFFDFIHAGLPSVNMNFPEYARICSRFYVSKLIDDVTVHSVAGAVKWFESNPQEYRKMVEACHDASVELSWVHESSKLVALWNEVILS